MLEHFFSQSVTKAASTSSKQLERPCPGLTSRNADRLPIYLRRTAVSGGGSRSITIIANERFNMAFSCLKAAQKKEVYTLQQHEHKWRNDHNNERIFSTECQKTVFAIPSYAPQPCSSCHALLRNKRFKNALARPIPDDANFIYVNYRFRAQFIGELYARTIGLKEIIQTAVSTCHKSYTQELISLQDAKNTPCIRYAQGVLKGKFESFSVFVGLVEAMVSKVDRLERGVGMQNFRYAPAWDELCHIVNIHSPRAYRALLQHLPMRQDRSFQ